MRAFVAVEMAAPIRRALCELVAELRRCDAPVKWVAPENIHLTLKFLGDLPDAAAPETIDIVKQCAEGVGPFELEVRGAGGFPNLNRPRVLFVTAADRPAVLADLAGRLNQCMTRAGVPREGRRFRRHITLGRVRRPRPMPELGRRLAALAERSFGVMMVERIVFMQSELTRSGPIYTPVAHVPLPARGLPARGRNSE